MKSRKSWRRSGGEWSISASRTRVGYPALPDSFVKAEPVGVWFGFPSRLHPFTHIRTLSRNVSLHLLLCSSLIFICIQILHYSLILSSWRCRNMLYYTVIICEGNFQNWRSGDGADAELQFCRSRRRKLHQGHRATSKCTFLKTMCFYYCLTYSMESM